MNSKLQLSVIAIALFAAGLVAGWALTRHPPAPQAAMAHETAARKPLFYRSPMNPDITSPVPAQDEMGMDYVPVYAEEAPRAAPGTVTVDPATVQSMGVRTAKATPGSISHRVIAPGRVDYDETTLRSVHPKIDGWVEKLVVAETGQQVSRGDVLLSIYSPNLVTTEQEYLLTLSQLEAATKGGAADAIAQAKQVADAARQRLVLLDVPGVAIKSLETSRTAARTLDIVSPYRGTVTRIGARDGQYVTPGTELFAIADLSHVWVTVDVYEQDLPWIKQGDTADIEVMAMPGKTFEGKVAYIYPYMDARSRTQKVRLDFTNSDGALKPEMFVNANIHASAIHQAVLVPSESIVRSGLHQRVFIALGGGRFEPRDVTTGIEADGTTQVAKGLAPGEEIVTSAQFLIDSESRLNEATAKMMEAAQ